MSDAGSPQEVKLREINVSTYVTLDGVFDDPGGAEDTEHGGWRTPTSTTKAAKYAREQLWSSDTLLVGRKTYEEFAANWPTRLG
jgi:dihydrofolate reductase